MRYNINTQSKRNELQKKAPVCACMCSDWPVKIDVIIFIFTYKWQEHIAVHIHQI